MIKKILSVIVALLGVFILGSCEKEPETQPPAYYLEPYNLTDAEKEIILKILVLDDIAKVTERDVLKFKTLTVAGREFGTAMDNITAHTPDEFIYSQRQHFFKDGGYGNELSALRVFRNLTKLELYFQPYLSDLSFLGELEYLTDLELRMVNVSDLTVLEKLEKLEALMISSCPVEKIKLFGENNITYFQLTDCKLTDLSPLSFLNTAVHSVFLSNYGANFTGLEFLSKFGRLDTLLVECPELDSEFAKNIPIVAQVLTLGGKNVDPHDISHMTSLTTLTLNNCGKIDLTPIAGFKNLRTLRLGEVKEELDLTPLEVLEALAWIRCSGYVRPICGEKTGAEGLFTYINAETDAGKEYDNTALVVSKYFPKS